MTVRVATGMRRMMFPLPPAVVGIPGIALLHFDGTNGSTTFTDVYPKTWTASNGAALSTAQAKFGPSSLLLASNAYISTPSIANLVMTTNDFTLEAQIYPTTLSGSEVIFGKQNSGGAQEGYTYFASGTGLQFFVGIGGTYVGPSGAAGTLTLNTWQHIALVRQGSTFTSYINGVSVQTYSNAGTIGDSGNPLAIGAAGSAGTSPFPGYIDEVKISRVAQYTGNFTPPSGPFAV
jgi:hypothetical protein